MYLRYLKYVLRHKWFVFKACCKLGVPWLGVLHDLSKLRPDEFGPYARYFYGPKYDGPQDSRYSSMQVKADFDRAWLTHIHRNRHHPQHWVLRNDSDGTKYLPMPDRYVSEMVADWVGAGMAIKGHGWEEAPAELKKWWNANKDKSGYQVHPWTEQRLENTLAPIFANEWSLSEKR